MTEFNPNPGVLTLPQAVKARVLENADTKVLTDQEKLTSEKFRVFNSRAEFEAATVPASVTHWTVLHEGRALEYVRDDDGTAIESANGVKGSPAGDATVLHWGAVPDAGDVQALLDPVLAQLRELVFPAGDYHFDGALPPVEGVRLLGREGARLVQTAAPPHGSGRSYFFGLASDMTLENLHVAYETPISGTSGFYFLNSQPGVRDVGLHHVQADYGQVIDPTTGQPNTLGGIVDLLSGTDLDGLTIAFSTFERFFWGFLKGNGSDSVERNITVAFSAFENFGSVALLFNSPHPDSAMENILVMGNHLGANHSRYQWDSALPGYGHKATFAGNVRYGRFVANHGSGVGDQLVRAEEQAEHIVWALNTAECEGYNGMEIIPNQAGGEPVTPQAFVIMGNNLRHKGVPAGHPKGRGTGLKLHAWQGNPNNEFDCTLHDSAVIGNVWRGFEEGLRHTWGSETVLSAHNVLSESDIGLRVWQPSLSTRENMVVDCTTAVRFEHPGMIGKVHFRRKESGPFIVNIERIRSRAAILGWTWETHFFDMDAISPSSNPQIPIIRTGDRMSGTLTAMLTKRNSTIRSVVRGLVSWDNSTFTYTSDFTDASGALVISSTSFIRDADGRLTLQLFTNLGGTFSDLRLQMDFDGLHVFN